MCREARASLCNARTSALNAGPLLCTRSNAFSAGGDSCCPFSALVPLGDCIAENSAQNWLDSGLDQAGMLQARASSRAQPGSVASVRAALAYFPCVKSSQMRAQSERVSTAEPVARSSVPQRKRRARLSPWLVRQASLMSLRKGRDRLMSSPCCFLHAVAPELLRASTPRPQRSPCTHHQRKHCNALGALPVGWRVGGHRARASKPSTSTGPADLPCSRIALGARHALFAYAR